MIKLNKQSLTTILGYRLLKDTTADHAQTITYAGTVENFQNTIMM